MTTIEEERIRLIAGEVARDQIVQHLGLCPFNKSDVERRLRGIEISFGKLIGFMLGSGLLGGTAGGIAAQLIK